MKVLRLRTHYGIPALKGENAWTAGEAGTELRMVSGGAVVSKYGKHVWIPAQAMVSADVEPEKPLTLGMVSEALAKGNSMGEAEPPVLMNQSDYEAMKAVDPPKRAPGRPKKEPVAT
jgi:hypothetical protein